jgi:hypothetical protein
MSAASLICRLAAQHSSASKSKGDQDIAANHGHDLGEVLADLDGKPSQVQLAPKPAT